MSQEQVPPYEQTLRKGGSQAIRETSSYFAKRGPLFRALHELVQRLNAKGIPYALLGTLAMTQYGHARMIEDINILLSAVGLEQFCQQFIGRGYRPAFEGAQKSFRDTETGVRIDVVITNEYPGDGLPKPITFPDPANPDITIEAKGIRVLKLEKLIELKLASGLTTSHRLCDLADVQDLIVRLNLPISISTKLDPSIRETYLDFWQKSELNRDP
jgi:hypothetical protein